MPFTPYHFGPALFLGVPLRKYMHAPTFILANIVLDVEPLFVLTLGLSYPLHGYFHTFIAAIGVGVLLGLAIFFLERVLHPLYKTMLLVPEAPFTKTRFLAAGVSGTMLHVLFDAPLYGDIRPFYPLAANPLYGLALSSEVYLITVWMGILGAAFYLLLALFSRFKVRKHELLR